MSAAVGADVFAMENLDAIASWFTGLGIHPVLGAFLAGLGVGLIVRASRTRVSGDAGAAPSLADQARNAGMFQKSTVAVEHGTTSLSINGSPVPIAPKVMSDLVAKIRSGHTIDAIKLAREATGLGLKESKLLIDTLAQSPLLR